MNENEENNKFKETELLVGGMFTLGVDGVCILLDLTGIGAVITPVIQSFVTFTMWLWFTSKGDKNAGKIGRWIVKLIANAAPFVPATFAAFIIEALIHNHPKVAKVAGQVAGTAVGAAVAGPVGARVGAAVGEYAMGGSATESAAGAVTPAKAKIK